MRKMAVLRCILILLISGMITVSCSKFRTIEKSEDWRVKYDAAMDYYEHKDYFRASTLFEQILPIVRGLPEGEKVQFYYAYAEFYQRLYTLAAHHFKTFYETYGRSEFAEEAEYMYAYSLYADSPSYNLDQSNSKEALTAMQTFMDHHPSSELIDDASGVINEIQQKLEKKGYENARQYFKLESYKAAVIAFESFENNFPDSEYNEEGTYLKFLSQYLYAQKSIVSKQLERFREANKYYLEFLDKYPESQYVRDAEKRYKNSLEKVTELAQL